MTAADIAARRAARGMADPLNRLRADAQRRIAEGSLVPVTVEGATVYMLKESAL